MTQIIDGKSFALALRAQLADAVSTFKHEHGITPGLAVILVGEDAASHVYVASKKKACLEAGMQSFDYHLPATTTQTELLNHVIELNMDARVHGILVQLPLPAHIDERAVINAIDPAKDVDGFHVVNVGKLVTGQTDGLISCTPLGCLLLLKHHVGAQGLAGKHAVVIGRSNIVGKPMAQLLLNESCTVTICHSRTQNIADVVRQADIVVAAVGKPRMICADWVKPGAAVIDVGINRVDGALVGDVDFKAVSAVAGAITPVPGGVGPMTIACLLRNTLQAACQIHGATFAL